MTGNNVCPKYHTMYIMCNVEWYLNVISSQYNLLRGNIYFFRLWASNTLLLLNISCSEEETLLQDFLEILKIISGKFLSNISSSSIVAFWSMNLWTISRLQRVKGYVSEIQANFFHFTNLTDMELIFAMVKLVYPLPYIWLLLSFCNGKNSFSQLLMTFKPLPVNRKVKIFKISCPWFLEIYEISPLILYA